MKAASFDYVRPQSIDEVCALLADDADAAIIAGGQTLVPMMAMRLARPTRLIDIVRIAALRGIRDDGGAIAIGATTRQAEAESSALVARAVPLLAKALPWVGHTATRNRGTIGGSVANGDPAAEIPLVLVTLAGEIVVRDRHETRTIAARDFFLGPMMTAMGTASCVTEIRFPVWGRGRIGVGFQEVSARRSDFALVAAAAQVAIDESDRCRTCAIGIGGATPAPVYLEAASAALVGSTLSDETIRDTIAGATGALDIMTSPHASDSYRRRVAGVLAARAVAEARDQAIGRAGGAIQ